MSAGAGHKDGGKGERDLDKALADHRVKRRLAQHPRIVNLFDLPYLGGYSNDGERIYFDRHLKPIHLNGRKIDARQFVKYHEQMEKALIDIFGMTYEPAHQLATLYEHRAVRRAGLSTIQYEKALKPQIHADEHEKLKRLPPDLDMTPYSGALKQHIERVMRNPEPKLSKNEADYQLGMRNSNCGKCQSYSNHNCTVVSGNINPGYWCTYYLAKEGK